VGRLHCFLVATESTERDKYGKMAEYARKNWIIVKQTFEWWALLFIEKEQV